jgi:hypothetical protein
VFQQQAPAAEAEPLPSSSSSTSHGDPPGAGGVDLQLQLEGLGQGAAWARTPPLPRRTSTSAPSLKRATREGAGHAAHGRAREFSLTASSPAIPSFVPLVLIAAN